MKDDPQIKQIHADRLEWVFDAGARRWRGFLKGHPDLTLFILKLVEGREDRCDMLGGVMPDEAERQHKGVLLTWAKMAAEWYLNDFEQLLGSTNLRKSAKSADELRNSLR